jgi:DEAD/DEAH box helicase domain-containing protein
VDAGLRRLVRHTLFEGQDTERLVRQAGAEMELAFDEWQAEWQALIEQESGLGPGGNYDPAARAIGFQKKRLAEEYLLRELATQGFLPGYGFPTSIASFDNTTVSAARRLPPPDAPAKRGRDDNRFQKRDLASRDLVTALREYAPGAELVMDGLVYRSAGITLNWHIPADQEGARETQAIKFAWRCRSCGASGTTMSLKLASSCDACGAG